MDITMIGLQNAGKTSLLRVLAVSLFPKRRPQKPDGRRRFEIQADAVFEGRRVHY